jgi:hypothetical protein
MRRFATSYLLVLGLTLITGNAMADSGQTKPPLQYELSQVTISIRHQTSRGIPGGYKIIVSGDGTGSYVRNKAGKSVTTNLKITKEQLLELINVFYRIHFFELADSYSVRRRVILRDGSTVVTGLRKLVDMGGAKVCIRIADYQKCITMVDNQPVAVADLVKTIETMVIK